MKNNTTYIVIALIIITIVIILTTTLSGKNKETSMQEDIKVEINNQENQNTMQKNIVETAIEAGSFNTLVTAVKAADLVETLSGPGPFTVFAPTDEAFAKLPKEYIGNPQAFSEVPYFFPGNLSEILFLQDQEENL